MPEIKTSPCAHCNTHFPLWEMVYVGKGSNGPVYICMPCNS